MNLYVKNMVCTRCILSVREVLNQLEIEVKEVDLGKIQLDKPISAKQLDNLNERLHTIGFQLLDDNKARDVELVKNAIVSLIQGYQGESFNTKISVLLENKLQLSYQYLASIFTSVQGITIEKYVILQRVEKVKELIRYDEMSVKEIADYLGYSSAQHLSQQFKKITGLTPLEFKQLKENRRNSLDNI